MNKLISKEHPILVMPSLANSVGLNEAIFLQQLHYWLKSSKHYYDGCHWVFNTYEDWQEQFPFWSTSTIQRTTIKLLRMGVLMVGNYNRHRFDKTKWYSIDYELLNEVVGTTSLINVPPPKGQDGTIENVNGSKEHVNLGAPIPETTSEITKEEKSIVVDVNANERKKNAVTFFEENGFGTVGGYLAEKIYGWQNDLSDELLIEAMKYAVERGSKHWKYVEAILRYWADRGYRTVEEVRAADKAFKERLESKSTKPIKMGRDIPNVFVYNINEGEDEE